MKNRTEYIKNEVKSLIAKKGLTLSKLAVIMAKKFEHPTYTIANLSNKLRIGTLRHNEFLDILEVLGYDFTIIDKQKNI